MTNEAALERHTVKITSQADHLDRMKQDFFYATGVVVQWISTNNLPAPARFCIEPKQCEVDLEYEFDTLTPEGRRTLKRKFGKFRKNYGSDLVSSYDHRYQDDGPLEDWAVTVKIRSAFECRQVCLPKDHNTERALLDMGLTEEDLS